MDYEKKYKEAIERAKEQAIDGYLDAVAVSDIFPELTESEDERMKKAIIATIHLYYGEPLEDEAKEMIAWFEKQREQKPAEWSEEDERLRNSCISHIEEELERIRNDKYGHSEIISDLKESCRERINWLISLRPRNTWKPSDEQMTALRRMKAAIAGEGEIYMPLNSLYEDLKKLREE